MNNYRWIIHVDHLSEEHDSDAGRHGPLDCYKGEENPAVFAMYDDDGVLYYAGVIWGDYTGFEPLDDYGSPYAGCTEIWINGERL